ncbi:MAG: glycosyltransferase family A protein [Candidatus Nanoarchaeia archaeon]
MISVIIPAYNEEKYIEQTLQSLQRQTYKNFETIVVCNGCTDKTPEIAERYGCRVVKIKERNVSKARNKGAEAAKNNVLVFLDADTLVSEDTLEKISRLNGVGVTKVKAKNGKLKARIYLRLKNLQHHLWGSSGLIFCNKEVFNKVGGFDENMSKGEVGKFIRAAKMIAKHYIADTYVYTSTRRYDKVGYLKTVLFWIKEYRKPTKEEYEPIR